ncbi:MAG: TolC family protein [Hydrogenovibrio sp.]|uniref:TolC family protein n=1 Tax=Hydrogenovibrio sp. TaxID=2065821 RepID=UPI00287036CF|nr:TolC family protein [Hydrogenovibrio sp.]MDR9498122.1 TolC family protein [Hydrogenovibrio sp.]
MTAPIGLHRYMRRLSPLAMALGLLGTQGVASASTVTLDFKACVETALGQNPEMTVSEQRIVQAEAALSEAEASRMPQITASLTGTRSNDAMNVFGMKLGQRQASLGDFGFNDYVAGQFGAGNYAVEPDDLNYPGAHNNFNSRLEVKVPVWNGGRIGSYEDQAQAMIAAARQGDEATQQYLTFSVYQAYEGVHTARAFIEVAQQAVEAAQAYVETTENLVAQGVVVRSELLSANVHLSEAQTHYEQALMEEQIALDNLKMLMAMDEDAEIEIGARQDITLPEHTAASMSQEAISVNPQLEALRAQTKAKQAAIAASKADKYPSFNLMARGDANDENLGFDSTSYTIAGVLSWKLTDFGVTNHRISRARAEASEAKASLQSKMNQTRLAVKKAWRMLQVAEKRVVSNELAVAQAEEAQRLIMKRYKGGIATMTEVLANQAQLDKARADLVKSQYEKNIQKATLRLETGAMTLARL